MKKILIDLCCVVLGGFLIWQFWIFYFEPKVIEVLPMKESKIPSIDPYYSEPVRVVFNREIPIGDISYSIEPDVKLVPAMREVQLRNVPVFSEQKYPAYVLINKGVLKPKTSYTVIVSIKPQTIYDFIANRPRKILFRTVLSDGSMKHESGADLDKRLFGK